MSTLKVENIKHTNDSASATITSDGYFLPKAYAFRATKHVNTNWTSGGGTGSAITFDNISLYSAFNSGFDLSEIGTSGKIFIPVNGIYRISASFLTANNNAANQSYCTIAFNNTTGSGGQPGTTLQNCYDTCVVNSHTWITLNTIFKATSSDFVCVTKEDSLNYWSNGTNQANSTWGYNQVTCELIGTE